MFGTHLRGDQVFIKLQFITPRETWAACIHTHTAYAGGSYCAQRRHFRVARERERERERGQESSDIDYFSPRRGVSFYYLQITRYLIPFCPSVCHMRFVSPYISQPASCGLRGVCVSACALTGPRRWRLQDWHFSRLFVVSRYLSITRCQ